jgi:hypothetical protein
MNAIDLSDIGVQIDLSGVGHCWRSLARDIISADVAEELAAWILDDNATAGDEYTASSGQKFRIHPAA